jgi:hypothetical protein
MSKKPNCFHFGIFSSGRCLHSSLILCFYVGFGPQVPVVNPRHRRSLSEGNKEEKWLDHQPKNMAPLGTAFVPAGLDKVRRKSVTKLEKDQVAKCSRYSLTHQEEDTDGDVETHIYKVCG